jgi:hypothetical protein
MANPKSATILQVGDVVGLIGEAEHVAAARSLLTSAPLPAAVPEESHRPPTSLWLECDPSLFRIFAL